LDLFFGKKKRKAAGGGERKGLDDDLTGLSERLLVELGARKLGGMVRVCWNGRMRSTAGRAFWPEMRVELNPRLKEISEEQVDRTLRHELAHLLAYDRYPKGGRKRIQAHGDEWKQACADLGIPGERATHSLPFPTRKVKRKWRYVCPNCGVVIERVRRIKHVAACYPCCKKVNGGRYLTEFALVEEKI